MFIYSIIRNVILCVEWDAKLYSLTNSYHIILLPYHKSDFQDFPGAVRILSTASEPTCNRVRTHAVRTVPGSSRELCGRHLQATWNHRDNNSSNSAKVWRDMSSGCFASVQSPQPLDLGRTLSLAYLSNPSVNQSINQSIDWLINQSIDQSLINQSINQSRN